MPAEADILVVDDNPQNLAVLADLLQARGYKVRPADSGARALRSAALRPPDLVMLDISMPDMDGYEVCRRLKADAATAKVPVIFISVHGETLDKVMAFGLGAADYVTKPFQVEEVCARVECQLRLARAMKALGERNEQLARLDAEKNAFLGIVAHDLRNPLAVVTWCGSYFESEVTLTAEQAELLAMQNATVVHMLGLVDDLLDVANIEAGRLVLASEPGDILAAVRSAVRLQEILARRKSIRLEVEADPGLPPVSFDPGRLRQVLNNLVGNAIKYSQTGTTTRVRVRREADHVVVSVADEGVGVPPAERDRLFKMYGRTSRKPTAEETSTGLGLAIARRIVEAHGGRIWLETGEGPGATFSFSLPFSTSAT